MNVIEYGTLTITYRVRHAGGDGDLGNIMAAGSPFLENDPTIRESLFREIGWVKNYFKGPNDPSYVVLGVEVASYQYRPSGRRGIISVNE